MSYLGAGGEYEEDFNEGAQAEEGLDEDEALEWAEDEAEDIIDLTEDEPTDSTKPTAISELSDIQGSLQDEAIIAMGLTANETDDTKEPDFLLTDMDTHPVEIPDPWSGPRMFAEDYYAGGDVGGLKTPPGPLSPSHLTQDAISFTEANRPAPNALTTAHVPPPFPAFAESSPRMSAERTVLSFENDPDVLKGLYADLDTSDLLQTELFNDGFWHDTIVSNQNATERTSIERGRSVSPRPSLSTHVDWNWPPAFSGRAATGPGHLVEGEGHVGVEYEIFEISDEEEEEAKPEPPISESSRRSQAQDELSGPSAQGDSSQDEVVVPIRTDGHGDFGEVPSEPTGGSQWAKVNVFAIGDTEADQDLPGARQEPTKVLGEVLTTGVSDGIMQINVTPVKVASVEPFGESDLASSGEEFLQGTIIEEASDNEVLNNVFAGFEDQDVASVAGDCSAVILEYKVEEPVTGGRRTEEPDNGSDNSPPLADAAGESGLPEVWPVANVTEVVNITDVEIIESSDQAHESTASVEAVPQCLTTQKTQTDVRIAIDDVQEFAPVSDPVEAPTANKDDPSTPILAKNHTDPSLADANDFEDPLMQLQYPIDFDGMESDSMLSTGIPMPVSADPTVPDPTSVAHTPISPPSPASRDEPSSRLRSPSESSAVNAATYSRSASGLFTPRLNDDSIPSSPDVGTIGAIDVQVIRHGGAGEETSSKITPDFISGPPYDAVGRNPDIGPQQMSIDTDIPKDCTTSSAFVENSAVSTASADARAMTLDARTRSLENHPSYNKLKAGSAHQDHTDADADGDTDLDYSTQSDVKITEATDDYCAVGKVDEVTSSPTITPADDWLSLSDAELYAERPAKPVHKPVHSGTRAMAATLAAVPFTRTEASVPEDNLRAPKRKREASPMLPPRLRRALSAKNRTKENPSASHTVDKGFTDKGKAKHVNGGNLAGATEAAEDLPKSESASISGMSATSRLIIRRSRKDSRASSVASSSSQHSASSRFTLPSPTLGKNVPLPPINHAHGVLHHHHGRSRTNNHQTGQQKQGPSSNATDAGQPRPVHGSASQASSPVTRSNCRFHKVSIPREENGPRIFFVVPRCSLVDAKLMQEEEIIDHGPAAMEDHARLIGDIDALALDPYVVAAMRQLAGVELVREGELFYLPQVGEQIRWKGESKWQVVKGKVENMDSISARQKLEHASSRVSAASQQDAPISQAASTSSTSSAQQASRLIEQGSTSASGSISGSDLSDLEDEGPPLRKPMQSNLSPVTGTEPHASHVSTKAPDDASHQFRVKRSKRLSTEASAYVPEGEGSEDSDGQRVLEGKRKRGGIKRNRVPDATDEQPGSISSAPKKKKARPLDTH
ncbi:hypothetical protein CERSUDRAFT_98729 [Gelatoporia subvermispora B]|uniref:Uncharacterized protein n=1 Tax=Ceriporiopsis subvermispora (strain B) TaxID=914234 RepID=M2Q8E5_CERS8|nr:hypothetical protein CERSUDRAFT_98729 [Gelatoporia subvermispora B]